MKLKCRALGCARRFKASHSVSCPGCLEVPASDLYSAHSNYDYCCQDHLLKDAESHQEICKERQAYKTIIRVGAVCNKTFAVWSLAMFPFRVVEDSIVSKTQRNFVVESLSDTPRTGSGISVSHAGLSAIASFENCTLAIVLLGPLIAWLLQDLPTDIHEIYIEPKKACDLQVFQRRSGIDRFCQPATLHTVLQISPKGSLGGVVLDTSSNQYLMPVRSHIKSMYQRSHTVTKLWHEEPFGGCFERHRQKLRLLLLDESWITLQDEASLCTINNVLLAAVDKLGGRDKFLSLPRNEFRYAVYNVECALEEALRALSGRVCWAMLNENYWHRSDRLKKVVTETDGTGHKEIMGVFQRTIQAG